LADFEGVALRRNPAMSQAAAAVEAARGAWLQAGLLPNPVIGYSGQQIGAGGRSEQQGLYFGQEVVTAKKLRLSRQAASWRIEQAERALQTTRLRVLTDVRIGFYDVLIAQRRRDVAQQLVALSERAVEAAEALFQAEEVSRADPLRARIEADRARITLQTAQNQYFQAWRRLVAVSGLPELAPARLEGELTPDSLELSWEESLTRVLTQSPEIAAALANVESARWAVQRARAEAVPNIDIQAVIQDDRDIHGNDGALQLSVPVPIWNRNQGGIREARAQAASAAQAVDRLTLDLQSRLAVAFQRYASARNQVDKYSRKGGILENSERTLELVRAGYAAEEFDLLNLIAAQRTYFQTYLSYFDSLRELWASTMEIEGLLLSGSLPK
jgi:cobalt-zinc-cadmium efflux system outer membrane protein